MNIYELSHIFFCYKGAFVSSSKNLGLFDSYKHTQSAIQYYILKPGFCDNPAGFSIRQRNVIGHLKDNTIFEAIVYIHSEDYEFEFEIELGLFCDENIAREAISTYCVENSSLINCQMLIVEKILNKRIIGRKEWIDGFSVYTY